MEITTTFTVLYGNVEEVEEIGGEREITCSIAFQIHYCYWTHSNIIILYYRNERE